MNGFSIPTTQKNNPIKSISSKTDIVLIGSGIMSTTLGMFLKILEPKWKIHMYERLQKPTQESSNAWNNSGTGHSAFCELNYTTYNHEKKSIDISKAISINEEFEISLQFWSYLKYNQILKNPETFIRNVPHISFVWGEEDINFLKKRFYALQDSMLFKDMKYSENPKEIQNWAPLIINGRNKSEKIAATYMESGTDINFGEITQQLLTKLEKESNFKLYLEHDVININYHNNTTWCVQIIDKKNKKKKNVFANYVFIGGGGKSLNLLQTANIPESIGYAGFPVGGQFLITKNPKITVQHSAKVYGKASVNAPPMSVPHIDSRILNGNKILLFGPFATFSSKFLKYGSWLDLFQSLTRQNIIPIIQAGIDNIELIKYLINQLIMSNSNQLNILKQYYPTAHSKDWSLIQAGQRVQIIKKNNKKRGTLQFGTEIIHSKHSNLTALLGASPGASTSASISLKILKIMFNDKINSKEWKEKLTEIIPSYAYDHKINNNQNLINKIKKYVANALNLKI